MAISTFEQKYNNRIKKLNTKKTNIKIMHLLVLIFNRVYNFRITNKILSLLHFDYHRFFRLIGHTKNNLDVNKSYIVQRKVKRVVYELDLYKPTERSIYFEGVYERKNLKLVMNSVKKDSVFIDVGAHVGFYSIMVGKNIVNGGAIISFEPSADNYSRLIKNIKLNNLTDRIKAFPFALSNINDEKSLFLNPYNDGGNSLEKFSYAPLAEQKVRCIRFDDLNEVKYSSVDFIKIDVEGHQMKVLEGMKNTISRFHPSFLIEAPTKKEQDEVTYYLKEFGYSNFRLNSYGLDLICKF